MAISLRSYQNESIHLLREGFKSKKRQLLVLPTGAGKTLIFSEMCRRAAEKGTQVLILTDRLELFAQTFKQISVHALTPQRIDANSKLFYSTAPITVAMVETINSRMKKGVLRDFNPRLIVCDEAHKASFFKIIDAFPNALVIGCTATPTHKDLYKYYEAIVNCIDTPELIEQGYLAKCRAYQMQDNFDDVKVSHGEFDEKQLFDHFNKKKLYDGVVDKWREKCTGMKTIVYCVNIEHAEKTCRQFRDAGIQAECVSSKTPMEERKRILAAHAAGHFPVLTNCGVLTTGYDDPSLHAIIVNRATMALSLWLQMVGRGGRVAPGKSEFVLLDFGMNHSRHGLWSEPREWKLEPPKKKKKKGPAPIKNCPKCAAMIPASAMRCEFCGHQFERKTHEIKNGVLVEVATNTPPECKGKKLSELSIENLVSLMKCKRLGSGHVYRLVRARGESAVVEFADMMGYKTGWVEIQLRDLADCKFNDYAL